MEKGQLRSSIQRANFNPKTQEFSMPVYVLRLGHRIGRDKRISTHCGLVSRALDAKGLYYSGEKDNALEKSIKSVANGWGGDFEVTHVKNWRSFIKDFKGMKIHLTMYGLPIQKTISKIRKERNVLVIVGGEKVPGDVYQFADINLSVSSQPHSEIAALAVFLHDFFKGKELDKKFKGAVRRIVPQARGKKIIHI